MLKAMDSIFRITCALREPAGYPEAMVISESFVPSRFRATHIS
jgi:hypothetical protein